MSKIKAWIKKKLTTKFIIEQLLDITVVILIFLAYRKILPREIPVIAIGICLIYMIAKTVIAFCKDIKKRKEIIGREKKK